MKRLLVLSMIVVSGFLTGCVATFSLPPCGVTVDSRGGVMVEVEGYSRELCGGTHVRATGEIGPFIITAETSVAAGIRRIESLTGVRAFAHLRFNQVTLEESAHLLNCQPEELTEKLSHLIEEQKKTEHDLRKLRQLKIKMDVEAFSKKAIILDGIKLISTKVAAKDIDELKHYADLFRDAIGSGIIVSGTAIEDKANFVCVVTKDLIDSKKLKAGDIVKEVAALAGGSGGGSPHMALAGAKHIDKLEFALSKVEEIVRGRLQ